VPLVFATGSPAVLVTDGDTRRTQRIFVGCRIAVVRLLVLAIGWLAAVVTAIVLLVLAIGSLAALVTDGDARRTQRTSVTGATTQLVSAL
jgi:hypothetical protein